MFPTYNLLVLSQPEFLHRQLQRVLSDAERVRPSRLRRFLNRKA